jgi:6-phosphofructokinase
VVTVLHLRDLAQDKLRVVHVPKTIDNDLPLGGDTPTFGFETARHVGVRIVQDLYTDAQTTSRWYFVVTQGRQAGHLALGIGKAASATLTLIPEEFPERVPLARVVDILTGAIVKRLSEGHEWGVAVLAEGLTGRILEEDMVAERAAAGVTMHGDVRLTDVNLGQLLKSRVLERLRKLPNGTNMQPTIQTQSLGYELRCTDPTPFDMEYARDLGYSATKYLLEGGDSAMVSMLRGAFVAIPFEQMIDPVTKRTRIRNVDRNSISYKIALRYMTRLRRDDFEEGRSLAAIAAAAGLTPAEFAAQFEYVVEGEPPALRIR